MKSHSRENIYDPLCYGVELPYETVLYPLGFQLLLASNSPEVILAAREEWEDFPRLFEDKTIEIRVAVSDDEEAPRPSSLIWRGQRHLLALESDRHNFAVCDLDKGFSFCWIVPAAARDHDFFRSYFLNILARMPAWQTHLTYIHAACVARNGRGLLLTGASGAGKSCLAYACTRRGWTFVTDEISSLVRASQERLVLGNPRSVHLRDTAAALFPEMKGRLAAPNAVGKVTIEVRTTELGAIQTAFQSNVAAVVFLNRQADRPARLTPVSAADAFHGLVDGLPLIEPSMYEAGRAALRQLVAGGAFELRYSDFEEAVGLLEPLVA